MRPLSSGHFGDDPGREIDPDNGLMYYRARWYDPQQGRFISEDSIQFDGGSNWYGYVENSPFQFGDPTGLSKGDRWYGYRNRDFHKWFHRCSKLSLRLSKLTKCVDHYRRN
jgi:RHS repeat-associated protein